MGRGLDLSIDYVLNREFDVDPTALGLGIVLTGIAGVALYKVITGSYSVSSFVLCGDGGVRQKTEKIDHTPMESLGFKALCITSGLAAIACVGAGLSEPQYY